MKKRIFIIHGWGGSPEGGWIPWLAKSLKEKDFEVFTPQMPNTEEPKIEEWVTYLSELVGKINENTYFIGHSIGCQTIMRYLEKTNKRTGGVLFVAGWFILENLDEEEKEIAKQWIETPVDFEKIKKSANRMTLLISDNDPFGGFTENKNSFEKLGAKIMILPKSGHIEDSELPIALEEILTIAQ